MKLKTPTRANFSRSAKLCDQNLYHVSSPNFSPPKGYISPSSKQPKKLNQNQCFKSVSRQKRGNFRFKIAENKGEFIYYPDFNKTKSKSPSWVFPKEEKYENEEFVEYQFCEKHPLIRENDEANMRATQSMKSFVKDKVRLAKSISMISTSVDFGKNYSILNPRQTSPSGFFNQSKIKTARYLSKLDLCNLEAEHDEKTYTRRMSESQRGFIDFNRQAHRKPNVVRKSFQYFTKTYNHQKQFNNFSLTKHPTNPSHHIDFSSHLDRPQLFNTQKMGPNPQVISIDFSRPKDNNINLKLATFRDKIRTRFDRVEVEANTRLDIDVPEQKPLGMVRMERVMGRYNNRELFPVVDPIIKKAGDKEMVGELKKHVFRFEINQAMKPVPNPDVEIRETLKP